jgi:AAA+ superfamily predicted ATPase
MNPLAQRFIEVLTEDVTNWENAANSCESVLKYLSNPQNRKEWEDTAKEYRARAASHRALIETVKAEHS